MGARGPKPSGKLSVIEPRENERISTPSGMKPRAKRLFEDIVRSLPAEHFKTADVPLLIEYCEAHDRAKAAEGLIRKHGMLVTTGNGALKANPAIAIKDAAVGVMASLGTKLGITRSARRGSDKSSKETAPKSKRDGLMFGGKKA